MLNFIIQHSPLLYLTQSLWRDEVFSILVSEHPINWIVTKLSLEPPVYYILLHYWMKIFGNSEIATRSLSLFGVTLATILIVIWSEKYYKDKWIQIIMPMSFFLNPMIIYYAFEVRTYGFLIFFSVLTLYAYFEKKNRLFILAAVLGFYTHTYYIFLFISICFHWLVFRGKKEINKYQNIFKIPSFISLLVTFLLFCPWTYKIITQSGQLKNSWYFPVDLQLVLSVLGNIFIGYEGTPGNLWKYTALLSLILLIIFIFSLRIKKLLDKTGLLFISIFVPLIMVIGFSFFKPLYVNRYMISVTVSEILLVFLAFDQIKSRFLRRFFSVICLCACIVFNVWYPKQHAKVPIRDTFIEINRIRKSSDYYFAASSLNFFETIYYSQDRSKVFLYNPSNSPFPWYVGKAVFKDSYMASQIPDLPIRAFLIQTDGSYKLLFKIPENKLWL